MINFKFIASVILGIFVFMTMATAAIIFLFFSTIVNNTSSTESTAKSWVTIEAADLRSSAKKQH